MYTTASSSAGESSKEQGGALRRLVAGRRSQISALVELVVVRILLRKSHDIDIGVLHEFFLNTRGCDVYEITAIMV